MLTAYRMQYDYVKVHTATGGAHLTKEKISALQEWLPDIFIRVHRSFLINRLHIETFSREEITLRELKVPIGRKYQKEVSELLRGKATA